MKALSLKQPWVELVIQGKKTIELRKWNTSFRGEFYVHASKNPDEKAMQQELSLEAIDNSIELKSNYRDAYYLKGQLLKKAGKIEEARKSFLYILQNLDPNDQESKKELQ